MNRFTKEMVDKYATLIYINSEISKIIELIDNIDLTPLVTKSELENKKYLTSVPDEYVTESELNNMEFLTEQDLSTYATMAYVDAEIAALKKWVEDNYAKKTELDAIRARLENLEIEINKLKQDLEDMKTEVDNIKPVVTYSITYDLTSVTSTNTMISIIENNSYNTVLSCASGYDFSNVTVTMNGVDITNNVVTTSATDERTINISNVTGNIVITAVAKEIIEKIYTITYKLSGCTSTNKTSNLTGENNSYSTKINPNNGYEIDSIKVTMGGTNITNDVVTDNYIEISNVTGNIVITATAVTTAVTEEILTLHQGYPRQNSSSYDGDESSVSTSPIDITNLKSLTVTITQSEDDSVYLMYMNEYDENKLFIGDNYVGQSMSLKTYTLSESDLNNYRTLDTYLGFSITSNTFYTLTPSTLTVTAYYTYY